MSTVQMTKIEIRNHLKNLIRKLSTKTGAQLTIKLTASVDKLQEEFQRLHRINRTEQLKDALIKHQKQAILINALRNMKSTQLGLISSNKVQTKKQLADMIRNKLLTLNPNYKYQLNVQNKQTHQNISFDIKLGNVGQMFSYIAQRLGWGSDGDDCDGQMPYILNIERLVPSSEWGLGLSQQKVLKKGQSNCLIKPLQSWFENKRDSFEKNQSSYKRYNTICRYLDNKQNQIGEQGINDDQIQEICDYIKCNVMIHDLIGNLMKPYKQKKQQFARQEFKYYNTKFEHVDEYFSEKSIIVLTNQQFNDMHKQLQDEHVSFMYKSNLEMTSSIMVGGQYYHNQISYDLKQIIKNFNDKHDYNMKCRYTRCQFDFMVSQITTNQVVQLRQLAKNQTLASIDQQEAYSQYKLAGQYYMKFPVPQYYRQVPNDPQFALKYIGSYECILDLTNASKIAKIIYKHNTKTIGLTSPDIKYLLDNKASVQLLAGQYGHSSFDFEFDQNMIDKYTIQDEYKVRPFSIWTGQQLISNHKSKVFIHSTEPELVVNSCNFDQEKFSENDIVQCGNNHYHVISNREPKHISSRIHIAVYIVAYQRINMALQLEQMDIDQIYRIQTDGVYTYEQQPKLLKSFRHKQEIKINNVVSKEAIYINQQQERPIIDTISQYKIPSRITQCVGVAGGGKTHIQIIDQGLIGAIYVAPSNKLMSNKKVDYDNKIAYYPYNYDKSIVTYHNIKYTNYTQICGMKQKDGLLYKSIDKYYPRNIILDEISMVSKQTVEHIIKEYPNANVICCGDDKQLEYILSDKNKNDKLLPFECSAFNIEYDQKYEFNFSHRCKDDKLRQGLNYIRQSNETININDLPFKQMQEQQLYDSNIYNANDIIICSTNKIRQRVNLNIKSDKYKYRVIQKYIDDDNVKHHKGDIIISDTQIQSLKLIETHGMTCHSLQGETFKNKIFIFIENIEWAKGYIYTALSRAEYFDQIIIVKGQPTIQLCDIHTEEDFKLYEQQQYNLYSQQYDNDEIDSQFDIDSDNDSICDYE